MKSLPADLWRCLHDSTFWLVAAAGPVVWFFLWMGLELPITFASKLSVYSLIVGIVVYPILEEIVFRGAIQGWIRSYQQTRASFAGITAANLITSLIFTSFHFLSHTPGWAIAVFIPSLVFGWARDRYGHLTASILLHGFYNAGFFILFG